MHHRVLSSLLLAIPFAVASAPAAAPPAKPTRELIEQLQTVGDSDEPYIATITGTMFLPLDREGAFLGGGPLPAEALRELARRGASAVPLLVAHLRDGRLTRLTVEGETGTRTLTVGDLCYIALGQVVNRPYQVVQHLPMGMTSIDLVASSSPRVAALKRRWGSLTAEQHRTALLRDVRKALDESMRAGALKRLHYYYPDALESIALRLLALPDAPSFEAKELVESGLYAAKDARQRRQALEAFVTQHGKAGREAVLRQLFARLHAEEAGAPPEAEPSKAALLLAELFGCKPPVRSADRPDFLTALAASEKARIIREALVYDDSKKIDHSVRNILVATEDDALALACVERLLGRGYDADVERWCKRRLPGREGDDRKDLLAALDRLGWTPLHVGVARGWLDRTRRLLATGARPDAPSRNGETPLHIAAEVGDMAALLMLLQCRPALEGKDRDGRTAVQRAARNDHDEVVRLLLDHGCAVPGVLVAAIAGKSDLLERVLKDDPGAVGTKTEDGRTALFLAVRHGHPEAVRALVRHKADVNAALPGGWRPLHEAAAGGHVASARLLLEHKAAVDAVVDESGLTPLHVAAHNGHPKVARLLLEHGAAVDRPDAEGRSPLCHAAGSGHEKVARVLLDRKAKTRPVKKSGPVPLHAAAAGGHVKLIESLLDAGADVELPSMEWGETALHLAAGAGHVDAVRLLLDRKARVNARDKNGQTPLHHAVKRGQVEAARLLLERKADPNIGAKEGWTALHAAASDGNAELVALLLRHKADVKAVWKEADGGTPLFLAARYGHLDAVRLLLKHGANPQGRNGAQAGETALHAAALGEQVEVARLLLERGVPVDATDDEGQTPLHVAALATQGEETARLLLAHRANLRATTREGWEPLHLAAGAGNRDTVALLLAHKADVNAREKSGGQTALHLAISNETRKDALGEAGSLAMVRLLLDNKAEATIKDNQGRTPLDLAVPMKYRRVAELLRKRGARK
jgi:ankyrin repeat protein